MDIGLTLATALALGLVLWGIIRFHLRAIHSERLLPKVAIKIGGVDLQPFLQTMERAAVKLTPFGLGVITVYVWLS